MPGNWKRILILLGAAIISMSVFIIWSGQVNGLGYPLDDAWIHQTFARNLAKYHELSYFQGIPTTGSTSPLWSLLLSFGYYFGTDNYLWTIFLGLAALFSLGWLGEVVFSRITPDYASGFPWVGVILIFEWHLVWAAASGMETLILADIILIVIYFLLGEKDRWFWIGALIGIGVWIRPDAMTVIGPVALILGIRLTQRKITWRHVFLTMFGFIIFLLPYLYMNYSISEKFWPNTYFAKQFEYRQILEQPFFARLVGVFQQHIIGIGILLLPGFFYKIWKSIRIRDWVVISFVIWWIGFLIIYAAKLPVTYQHGRYTIPIMPVFFLLAGSGVYSIYLMEKQKRWGGIIVKTWIISIFLVGIGFFGIGANAYANDVAIIETEMVASAKWIERNTPSNSIIAAHDIGALGFYGNRKIIDLAGLISPEVIPYIRDEKQLGNYIQDSNADFLMTFPAWYPFLTSSLKSVFISHGKYSPNAGAENMVVYIIRRDK
jgi:hypothetical protein